MALWEFHSGTTHRFKENEETKRVVKVTEPFLKYITTHLPGPNTVSFSLWNNESEWELLLS